MPNTGKDILNIIREQVDLSDYRKVHWEGTFEEYLDIVRDHPDVSAISAYRCLYDMILSHGVEERFENKEKESPPCSSPSLATSSMTWCTGSTAFSCSWSTPSCRQAA